VSDRRACALAAALVLAVLGVGATHCKTLTEVLVVVDSDLGARIDTVAIAVDGPGGFHVERAAELKDGTLPVSLDVQAGSDPSATIAVTARGLLGGVQVATTSARTRFVKGEYRVLGLALCQDCVGVTCGADQACGASYCQAIDMPAEPPTGVVERVACSGQPDGDAGVDTGVDAGLDAPIEVDSEAADTGGDAFDSGCPCPIGTSCDTAPLTAVMACHVIGPSTCQNPFDVSQGGTFFAACDTSVSCGGNQQIPVSFFYLGPHPAGYHVTTESPVPDAFLGPTLDCQSLTPCVTQDGGKGPIDVNLQGGETFGVGTTRIPGCLAVTVVPN
jgi:hypothetical protein